MRLPKESIPAHMQLIEVQENPIAETNQVFRCLGKIDGRQVRFYLKISRDRQRSMENEQAVLKELRNFGMPVPEVLWYGKGRTEFLALSESPGLLLDDLINPKSQKYRPHKTSEYLEAYGEMLARIHSLPLSWTPQKRKFLYDFIGEEELEDLGFREVVEWLKANPPGEKTEVFVHGDLNPVNILIHEGEVSGILDWEFAGMGWKEYDLAWILRQRLGYLNSPFERERILNGYTHVTGYDPEILRWCEVMNFLHIAYWSKDRSDQYARFALQKAEEISLLGFA